MADMDSVFSISPLFDEPVSAVTATNSVKLGTRRIVAGEDYVYCYNSGGGTIAVKDGVKLVTGASGYSVANTSLTGVTNPFVGCCKHVAIPAASYGWIMSRGFMKVCAVSNITGDYVAVGLGAAGQFTDPTSALSGLGSFHITAWGLNVNTAAAGSFYAFIKANA